jgi:hypothetical protein
MSKEAATEKASAPPSRATKAPASPALHANGNNSFVDLQQVLWNQAMVRLLESGVIQAKLGISKPGDADEVEADRVAQNIVSASVPSALHRKCACEGSGSPCSKCEEEASGTIHRSAVSPVLRSAQLSLQRAPTGSAPTNTPDQVGNPPQPSPTPALSHPLVVEDDAKSVAPHQMRKSAFIALLRTDACAAADAVLASVGHATKSCPYVEKWLGFYEKQSSDHIERAILKYAPETATARSAHEAIRLVVMRVQRAALTWAKTGKVAGLPEDLASQIPGQGGFLGAIRNFASSGVGGAILSFIGGTKPEKSAADTGSGDSSAPTVSRKASEGGAAPAHDAAAVRSQLGTGHSLDSRVQSQMSAAFGRNFSGVRVHTDSRATALSSDLKARAFTVGADVAFASGEYKPGTLMGDALIAHELAHVVQQGADTQARAPMLKGNNDYDSLESDADLSAIGAVASLWAGAKGKLVDIGRNATPRLKSGLKLQRCGGPDRELNLSTWTAKQLKDFISKNFAAKDRGTAEEILHDMLQSNETTFFDEASLKAEIFKRLTTSKLMQTTQNLYGLAFEYPEHGTHCIPDNKEHKKYPRVNKAAEAYWGPVKYDSEGVYYFELTDKGKNDAYHALTLLFTPQKSGDTKKDICKMTLIHCDFLASVVHFRAFAEEIGVEEFNRRVKNSDINMRLAWNGFQELEDVGWFHSKKSISLREVRPRNLKDLVIGDQVIFFNHRAYDLINQEKRHAPHEWRLENAILVYRRGKEDIFEGHGSGINTNLSMLSTLANRYNVVVKEARDIIARIKSADPKAAAAATQEMAVNFPNVKLKSGKWNIVGHAWGKTFDEELRLLDEKHPEKEADLPGLRDPDDPSKMGCIKRPSEAPGEEC